MDGLQVLTPSEMLKSFMGTKELQSTYSDSHPGTALEDETNSTFCGQRESVSSSSRGSISSLSTISDDLSGSCSSRSKLVRRPAIRDKQRSFDGYPSRSRSSRDAMTSTPAKTCPYNPDEPLTIPIKMALDNQNPSFVRSRRFTIVGPLVQDVCKKLNIQLENSLDKSTTAFLKLQVPDHTKDEIHEVKFEEHFMLATLKSELISVLKKKQPNLEWNFIHDYQFIYITDDDYEYQLFDDYQYLVDSFFYLQYQKAGLFPLLIVEKKILPSTEELQGKIKRLLNKQQLNNRDSGVFDNIHDLDEVLWAKSKLNSFAVEVARYRNPIQYSMMTELDCSPVTEHFAKKVPPNNTFKVFIHVENLLHLERSYSVHLSANDVLTEVFPFLQSISSTQSQIDDYALQVTGEENYITGDVRLLDFKAVRKAIFKNENLHLSIVPKPNPIIDEFCCNSTNCSDTQWPLVDPFTGTAPSHDFLTSLDQAVNALSLWDMTIPFSVCIERITNIPLAEKDTVVEMQAGIYNGGKKLREMTTGPISLKQGIVWKEKLIFDLTIQRIPKTARLLIVIKESRQEKRKSSVSTKVSAELFWVATSLIDHRNLLKHGELELCMWPTERTRNGSEKPWDDDRILSDLNPNGPIMNNPNPSAVQLLVKLESIALPVFFPNYVPPESLLDYADPKEISNQQQQPDIEGIASKITQNPSSLQNYITKLDWSQPEQVAEAYNFLNNLREPISLTVAFKFLDSECPDEFIRAFAVERLRELRDDELINYLLQLVQALKFEANHDSALARFLLERALQNKLIGHFLFWYLRCEIQNPQFATRYEILLEAYLVACGKSMLDSFLDQVTTLMDFEAISKELDKAGSQSAMDSQKIMMQLLHKHKFSTKTVIPLHNPKLRLGKLMPEKCKVMQSKKMPMWLWMSNVHPSAIQPLPYKLIVKNGDDLRQDMLTLQMLTIFDKIWQEDGLDLCLIPYGCVATGPNSGIIEVVKDSKTIADISGIRDNTKLFQWIKNQQKDQFGEKDSDLLQSAIDRFVRSCAGYSVATYILGIGDRHNDNIMVTTSGNLFHIDFGHFLGNVKYFMKIKREWCPFVLTPDFIYVMGGEKSPMFFKFRNLCCKAFLSLRQKADLIINLFSIMRYTGIPELTCVEDIDYLRDALMVTKDDLAAEAGFIKLIDECIRLGWTVQVSWWAHNQKKRAASLK